jgi:hypothetical protein
MSATIHVNEDIKDRLRLLSRVGETDGEVLLRLIRYVEETDLKEIIEARWERLQRVHRDQYREQHADNRSTG